MAHRFKPGRLVATPGARATLERCCSSPLALVVRHLTGDWGELEEADRRLNEQAVTDGGRIFSAYRLDERTKIWVITEAAGEDGVRASTCVLLPDEY